MSSTKAFFPLKTKVNQLSSLLHPAIKTSSSSPSSFSTATEVASVAAAGDTAIKLFVSKIWKRKNKSPPKSSSSSWTRRAELPKLNSDESTSKLSEHIPSIHCGDTENGGSSSDSQGSDKGELPLQSLFHDPWFTEASNKYFSVQRKELTRERKCKWFYTSTQGDRFDRLVRMCSDKPGSDSTLGVFGRMGRERGIKEYNTLIALCIEEAGKSEDEENYLQQIYRVFQLFKSMKEEGFSVEEETYGQFLMYLIQMGMIDEFHFFCKVIKDANPAALSRLGYYEMRLWIHVNNEEKIKELCSCILTDKSEDTYKIRENYVLALCECNRTQELLQFFETVDLNKISSVDYMAVIFKTLGKLSLESYAEKFIMTCKDGAFGAENISQFIFNYVMGLPNLVVDGLFMKIKDLHDKLEVAPSSISFEKLIMHCCDSQKVHVAFNIIDQVFEAGSSVSLETFHLILRAAELNCEFNLVHPIYSLILRHDLNPNNETFRMMVTLSVKMKDYIGAYGMLEDVEKMNLIPAANLYYPIMAGYFQEKDIRGALSVLERMELAGVKPDSQTFYLLINNCETEEDIIKYYKELKCRGVPVTKHIYMALINAYARCGQFNKAKQVVSEQEKEGMPLRNALVSALASNGQISDALSIYEEMKESGYNLEPRAIRQLIECLQSEGHLSTLLQLLKDLKNPHFWPDACNRVISYCVRHKHLSSAVDLLKQLKAGCSDDELAMTCDEFFAKIAETKPVDVQNGLDLLQLVKEKLELNPSRKSLDFLLSACVKAKDAGNLRFVWNEYKVNGLPYNLLSYLRMYQGLLASGEHKSALNMLSKIPTNDPHVRMIIKACQNVYAESINQKTQKKKKKKIK